jgi:hypothetical protein
LILSPFLGIVLFRKYRKYSASKSIRNLKIQKKTSKKFDKISSNNSKTTRSKFGEHTKPLNPKIENLKFCSKCRQPLINSVCVKCGNIKK